MRQLIRPWAVSPLHVKLVHYAVHSDQFLIGNSPIASRSCEHMYRHLPGLRHRYRKNAYDQDDSFLEDEQGRRQVLHYLGGEC
jgi:hypothetical protein